MDAITEYNKSSSSGVISVSPANLTACLSTSAPKAFIASGITTLMLQER